MIPTKIDINKFNIRFKLGDGLIIYETEVNSFLENTGLTIQNSYFPLQSDKINYINLAEAGTTFNCGNALTNLFLVLKKEFKNEIVILDFLNVEEVSNHFLEKYTKFLLETSNKVIAINVPIDIANSFDNYIYSNLLPEE